MRSRFFMLNADSEDPALHINYFLAGSIGSSYKRIALSEVKMCFRATPDVAWSNRTPYLK